MRGRWRANPSRGHRPWGPECRAGPQGILTPWPEAPPTGLPKVESSGGPDGGGAFGGSPREPLKGSDSESGGAAAASSGASVPHGWRCPSLVWRCPCRFLPRNRPQEAAQPQLLQHQTRVRGGEAGPLRLHPPQSWVDLSLCTPLLPAPGTNTWGSGRLLRQHRRPISKAWDCFFSLFKPFPFFFIKVMQQKMNHVKVHTSVTSGTFTVLYDHQL